jgi:hypothetical protein
MIIYVLLLYNYTTFIALADAIHEIFVVKKKIVRIKDIAEKAQTSKGTVDRVLHNRGKVADDVRERILKIIKELNYEQDRLNHRKRITSPHCCQILPVTLTGRRHYGELKRQKKNSGSME